MEPALTLSPGCTKEDIRQKVWDYIENNNLADFPRPVHHRIPNFKGADKACQQLQHLQEFQAARTVKVNPDTPQKKARFLTLEAHKTLLVPTPRLRTGLFNKITPPAGASKEILKLCSTSQGVKDYSVPMGLDAKVHVDLIVVGSVAVSEKGWRIGKGEGFADMEYAMMVAMGAVTDRTAVVTIVHDCQVVDFSEELLGDHDLTVDFILTPTRVLKTDCKRAKPQGIIWAKISKEVMGKIPILRTLLEKERRAGKDVSLKNEGGSPTEGGPGKPYAEVSRRRVGMPSDAASIPHNTQQEVVSLYLGRIPPSTRVRELKTVLRERGAAPLNLIWQGAQHRAFLGYRDKSHAEKALTSLEGLSINGHPLQVELARTPRQNHQETQIPENKEMVTLETEAT